MRGTAHELAHQRASARGRGNERGIVSYCPERRGRSPLACVQQEAARVLRRRRRGASRPPLGYEALLRRRLERAEHRAGSALRGASRGPAAGHQPRAGRRDPRGRRDFWVSSPDSGLSGFERPPDELVPEGFSFTAKRVRCARLDTLIDEHASGRTIDFLKIDVEGAERDVLSSFDPETIRPTVILVEAISPLENRQNHEDWESLLVDHGYVFAAFDGINRFYVPVEHVELIDTLAYPMSVLDRYEAYRGRLSAPAARRRHSNEQAARGRTRRWRRTRR